MKHADRRHLTGAIECSVDDCYHNLTMVYLEKIIHVLPFNILDICRSVKQVFFPLLVQVDIPAGLKGQEVKITSFP